MGKFILFVLLWRLLGNPFIAILVILVIAYALERRYIGITPSLFKPFKRNRRLSALRRELDTHPHDTRSKLEAARLYLDKKRYKEAHDYLEQVLPVMDDSAEVLVELGLSKLELGQKEEGETLILQGLERNPRVRYGDPYLWLSEANMAHAPEKSLQYLEELRQVHSSSCEAFYRMGQLYELMGKKEEARKAYEEAGRIYRGLPKYKRKSERRWAILAKLKKNAK
jgi:tetratricopeptide (TPR) repeat protein